MNFQEQQQGAVTVVQLDGPLTEAEAEPVFEHLIGLAQRRLGRMVVDFSAVPFVDSRGLELLLDVADRMAQAGQTLRLCGTNETIREVLELTDVAQALEQFEDANAAVRSFL